MGVDEERALRESFSDRLLRFAHGDRAAVLGPAAERAARDLLSQAGGTTAEGRPTLSIVDAWLLGQFHWCRYQVLPPGERSAEVEPIRHYFAGMVTAAPEHVPEGVCELLSDEPQQRAKAMTMVVGARVRKHLERARQAKDVDELDMAIGLMQTLPLRSLPGDVAIHFYVSLSQAWRDRYDWAGDPADLEKAIAQCLAVRATGQSGVEAEFDYQGDLDKLLTRRYERTGRAEHLDEVVTERTARLAAAVGADRSHWRMRLASSLADRLERCGDPADLREAVQQCRAAAAETTGEDRGSALTLLFKVQSGAFFAGEQPLDDLSDVIATGSAALELLPEDEYVVPSVRTNVGYFQLRRYERTGDSTDLVNALELLQKAVETLPEDDSRCVTARARLAEALVMRHEQTVRQSAAHGFGSAVFSDLQQAIDLLTWCVDQASADDKQRARFLRNLADAYRVGADTDNRTDMLDGAVDALREVVALGGDDPSKALHQLARALHERFMALRHEADLTEAIGLSKKAIASAGAGTYEELTAQLGLAEALAMRLILDPSNDTDRRAAMEVYRRVAHTESAGLAAQVSASFAWARVAHDGGYLAEALAGYESMLTLTAEMAPIGLDDADRLRLLAQEDGRPALAVACAVAVGQLERAVELLERGRMMTAPAVSVAADDVEALRQRRPDLAEVVDAAHAELTGAAGGNEVMFLPLGLTLVREGRQDQRQRRDAAARNWQDAVAQVRAVPGFEGFLAPAGFAVLRNAAQTGPVVVLNASPDRCDALIVRVSGVDVVPLPVTYEEVLARVNRYGDAVSELNRAAQTLAGRQAAENELWRVLAWLWDSTVQPVLDALGLLGVVANGPWPRVWWSPGGLFSLFPLHAAGRTPEDGVMDRVQSSYAPSLRLLASLNSTADVRASDGPQRLLAVGLAQTPRLKNSHLPDVSRELAAATAACPPERQTVLRDALATHAAVEAALPEHDLLHFACHGRQFPQNPLASELHLYDRPLSVRDLRWSSLRRARLAVLSACQTALGGTTLMDEGLHLGAALHMAGCRDVVGTLWTVPDSSAAEIMESLYGHLRRDGELQPGLAAEALHLAVRDLRSEAADLCGAWAPFVHMGGGR
jgi:hypothetical protein